MAGRTPLRIELLGGFRLLEEGRAAARLPSARQQQVIGLLILHARRGPIPRQRVAGSLWPDSADEQALTNLRRELLTLDDLRAKLREQGIEDVQQVKAAFMESDGMISVVRAQGAEAPPARRKTLS